MRYHLLINNKKSYLFEKYKGTFIENINKELALQWHMFASFDGNYLGIMSKILHDLSFDYICAMHNLDKEEFVKEITDNYGQIFEHSKYLNDDDIKRRYWARRYTRKKNIKETETYMMHEDESSDYDSSPNPRTPTRNPQPYSKTSFNYTPHIKRTPKILNFFLQRKKEFSSSAKFQGIQEPPLVVPTANATHKGVVNDFVYTFYLRKNQNGIDHIVLKYEINNDSSVEKDFFYQNFRNNINEVNVVNVYNTLTFREIEALNGIDPLDPEDNTRNVKKTIEMKGVVFESWTLLNVHPDIIQKIIEESEIKHQETIMESTAPTILYNMQYGSSGPSSSSDPGPSSSSDPISPDPGSYPSTEVDEVDSPESIEYFEQIKDDVILQKYWINLISDEVENYFKQVHGINFDMFGKKKRGLERNYKLKDLGFAAGSFINSDSNGVVHPNLNMRDFLVYKYEKKESLPQDTPEKERKRIGVEQQERIRKAQDKGEFKQYSDHSNKDDIKGIIHDFSYTCYPYYGQTTLDVKVIIIRYIMTISSSMKRMRFEELQNEHNVFTDNTFLKILEESNLNANETINDDSDVYIIQKTFESQVYLNIPKDKLLKVQKNILNLVWENIINKININSI